MPAISLRGVGKKYKVHGSHKERLKEAFGFGGRRRSRDFWALEDVSMDVEPGITLGIVGRNGAGKSTLLKVISGVVQPSTGTVEVNGLLVALFGVGSGFNAQFTGRENAMLNGLLLGLERREMLERFDEIEAFADIGEFMDQPVKTYSSGMRARLGFAVAINVEPDVLIVDETLAVGDAPFKQASMQRMRDLRDSGTTILFVSHSLGLVKDFCDQAILLHKGRLLASGETGETLDRYEALLSNPKARGRAETQAPEIEREDEEVAAETRERSAAVKKAPGPRRGTGEAKIRGVEVLDGLHEPVERVASGSTVTVRVHLRYLKAVKGSSLGITLRNGAGVDVFATSTRLEGTPLGAHEAGERVTVDFTFEAPFKPGEYEVAAGLSHGWDTEAYLDRVDAAATFEMIRPENGATPAGLVRLPAEIRVHDREAHREEQGRTA